MNTPAHHNPEPDGDFELRLRERLQASPIDLPQAAGPHAAADRAHQRSRRRRTGLVVVAAVALVGGLAAPSVLDRDDDAGVNTNVAAPIDTNGVELDWQVHDDGLVRVDAADEGDAGFYALSTAPNTRWQDFPQGDIPRALYRWSDGAWQPIALGDDDPNVAKVSERDGALYALSTAADTGEPVGSVSTDGGETWTSAPLGDIQPPSDDVAWTMSVGLEVASTADTTIAVVSTRFMPPGDDLFEELRDDRQGGDESYWRTSEAGVELIEYSEEGVEPGTGGAAVDAPTSTTPADADPESADLTEEEREAMVEEAAGIEVSETVVRTIPWSDLGVSGIDATSKVTTYQAEDDTWTAVSDGPASGVASGSLVSTDSGFLLQTFAGENGATKVWHTTDGTAWQAVATPAGDSSRWGQTVLAPNGHLLDSRVDPAGHAEEPVVSVSTNMGASWTPVDIASIVPELDAFDHVSLEASTGPLGVALVATGFSDGGNGEESTQMLLYSADLQSWSVTNLDAITPDATPHLSGPALVGTDHIIVPAAGPSDPDDDIPGPSATLVATPVR